MKREELLIEEEELVSIINDSNLRFFDATVALDPASEGTPFLDHATISDLNSILRHTISDEKSLGEVFGGLGISRDTPVVVYATEMMALATRIWWVLKYAGHRNVRVLNGGMRSWKGDLETAENKYLPTIFNTDLSSQMFANREEVLTSIGDGSARVVNTLTPEMYRGGEDIFYARHITGSVNYPPSLSLWMGITYYQTLLWQKSSSKKGSATV